MAYDPALTAFILAGMVGGAALVMNASSDWEIAHELATATNRWTAPIVVRSYEDSPARHRRAREAAILQAHGYEAERDGDPKRIAPDRVAVTFRLAWR